MLRAHFYKGVDGARGDTQVEAFPENPGNITIGSSFTTQLADEFPVGFEFGTRRLGREVCEIGDVGLTFTIRGGNRAGHNDFPEAIFTSRSADDHLAGRWGAHGATEKLVPIGFMPVFIDESTSK